MHVLAGTSGHHSKIELGPVKDTVFPKLQNHVYWIINNQFIPSEAEYCTLSVHCSCGNPKGSMTSRLGPLMLSNLILAFIDTKYILRVGSLNTTLLADPSKGYILTRMTVEQMSYVPEASNSRELLRSYHSFAK